MCGRTSLGVARLLCSGHRIDKVEELLHVSNFERVLDPLAHADQVQAPAIFLVGNVSTDQRANSGRVHIGNFGKVDHQRTRGIGADLGLKVKQGG